MGIYFVLGMIVFAVVFIMTALHFDDKRKERMASTQNS